MPIDFLDLIHRDHRDLDTQLSLLVEASTSLDDLQSALDAVVLGLTAHAEAEHHALGPLADVIGLQTLVAQIQAEHLVQERALSALVCAPLGTECGRMRAESLRDLIQHHALREEYLPEAIRTHAPPEAYRALAAAYATERLRQLSTLHPLEPSGEPARVVST